MRRTSSTRPLHVGRQGKALGNLTRVRGPVWKVKESFGRHKTVPAPVRFRARTTSRIGGYRKIPAVANGASPRVVSRSTVLGNRVRYGKDAWRPHRHTRSGR